MGANSRKTLFDLTIVCAFVVGCMLMAEWRPSVFVRNGWIGPDFRSHLGAECNEIALAIRQGRGFSDPFCASTGSTAWMPPAFPYVLAFLYWITGDSEPRVIQIVLMLQGLSVCLGGYIVVRIARDTTHAILGYVVFVLGCFANFPRLFQMTDETFLLSTVLCCIWLLAVNIYESLDSAITNLLWGLFGGIITLCSPIYGTIWIILTALGILRIIRKKTTADPARLGLCMIAYSSVVGPWIVRNYLELGYVVPVKSNAMFELWQSHCLDDDGVLDTKTTSLHPWPSDGEARKEYVKLGEIEFVRKFGALAIGSIRQNPLEFLRRVNNRIVAAYLWFQPYRFGDRQLFVPMWFRRFCHAIPTCCIPIALLAKRHRRDRILLVAIALHTLVLFPYVLISYYERYAIPVLYIKMAIVVYGFEAVYKGRQGKIHNLSGTD